jgi:uncharacterized membrane protein YdjX (TVP38/TMEM64 family)
MQIKRHHRPWLWIIAGIALFIAICTVSPAKVMFDEAFLVSEFRKLGGYAPLFFVLVLVAGLSVGLPANIVSVAGGAIFGLGWGTVWSLVGSTLGAVSAFLIARSLLHDWIMQRFGYHPWLQRINTAIARYPFTFTFVTRSTPLSPFSLVNFLFGLTPIDLKTYTVSTFLGLVPLSLTYSWLGSSGYGVLHGGDRLPFLLALSLLTLLTIFPFFTRKVAR